MNILIADDHELVRGGLARIVAEEFPFAKIQEASNGTQAEKAARSGNLLLWICLCRIRQA
jgi:DNA-binding NarL/FixJ family response regulator